MVEHLELEAVFARRVENEGASHVYDVSDPDKPRIERAYDIPAIRFQVFAVDGTVIEAVMSRIQFFGLLSKMTEAAQDA